MRNLRGHCWLEASDNIKQANRCKQGLADPAYWAYILMAIVNGTMACVPDTVMDEVAQITAERSAERKRMQDALQRKIKEKLNGK